MADFNKPTVDSNYTQFPNEIRAAISEALSFLDGGTHTNIPMKAKRWNPTSKIFEEYNGSQWLPMATEYKLPVDYNVLRNKPVPSSATNSDNGTQFASSKAVKTVYDLASGKQSPATTLEGYGITDFVVKDLTTEDLNNVTVVGFYSQRLTSRATINKNYPVNEAGSLVVKPSAYVLMQEYTTHSNKRIYIRNRTDFSGAWSEWKQVDASINEQRLQESLQKAELFKLYFVGVPIPWMQSILPTVQGLTFLTMSGQPFNKLLYPILAQRYPSGVLPDLRGEFIRGFDNGRNIDVGRQILSSQGDAIRNITGNIGRTALDQQQQTNGAFTQKTTSSYNLNATWAGSIQAFVTEFNVSNVVPTANENRPRNIAFQYICIAA